MKIETKNFSYDIKDVDKPAGIVDIFVNAYGNKDSDGDVSAEGCFDKTVIEDFRRIKHLLNHDSNILLGLPLEFPKDSYGLRVRSKTNTEKALVKDVLSDYVLFKDNNRTLEHSIGFQVIKRDDTEPEIIKEYKLYEYSTLTGWGANPNTPFVDLKGLKSEAAIFEHIELLVKMYNANYSDGRLKQVENELNILTGKAPNQKDLQLQAMFKQLSTIRTELKNL